MRTALVSTAIFFLLGCKDNNPELHDCRAKLELKQEEFSKCDRALKNEKSIITSAIDGAYHTFEAQDDKQLRTFIMARNDYKYMGDLIKMALPTLRDVPYGEIIRSPAVYKNRPIMFTGKVINRKDNAGLSTSFVSADQVGGHQYLIIYEASGDAKPGENRDFIGISEGVFRDEKNGMEFPMIYALPPLQPGQIELIVRGGNRRTE